jgi:hypothetical protein
MFASKILGRIAVPVLLGSLALASCSSSGDGGSQGAASSGVWAMTGEPRPSGQDDATVLTVKIENTKDGQVAVSDADLVTELPVEGGLTRLAAFYESTTPDRVGPVRSARNSDIGLVKPANSVLVASGGAKTTLEALARAGITLVDENSPGMTRDPNISSDNNVFANLAEIRGNHSSQLPTQAYLDFGDFRGTGGDAATDAQITFSGVSNEGWTYDSGSNKWQRQALGAYSANTLLVFKVALIDAGYKDAAGSSVPVVVSTGQGDGWIATGGQVYEVKWSKAADDAPWKITSTTGQALQVPAGNTWISLIPNDKGKLAYS